MALARQGTAAIPSREGSWWQPIDDAIVAPEEGLDVRQAPAFNFDWCTVAHVTVGATPHRVRFCRDSHTLLVFDRGSFVDGERWVDGTRLSTSGPLDVGIDVVPAHTPFHALARPGSNVSCTLISVAGGGTDDLLGKGIDSASSLRPSIGLENELLSELADRLRASIRSHCSYDGPYIESLCVVLFREVLFAQQGRSTGGPPRPTGGLSLRAQRQIKDFLHAQDRLDQKIGLQELADLVGVSRFHFTRAFKVSFGLPPHKYLLNLRLRKAADLLRTTSLPITSIALSVGFSCSSEFARAFKEAINYSPREFRQNCR